MLTLASAAGHSAAAAPAPCDLALKLGARSGGGQAHVDLRIVDVGSTACRVSGFPDVELIGPVDPAFGSVYALPRQAAKPSAITLRSGDTAHALLTWLPASGRGSWAPGYIRVVVSTAAGPSLPMALPWRFGAVLRQDAATHPGTYVGPLR